MLHFDLTFAAAPASSSQCGNYGCRPPGPSLSGTSCVALCTACDFDADLSTEKRENTLTLPWSSCECHLTRWNAVQPSISTPTEFGNDDVVRIRALSSADINSDYDIGRRIRTGHMLNTVEIATYKGPIAIERPFLVGVDSVRSRTGAAIGSSRSRDLNPTFELQVVVKVNRYYSDHKATELRHRNPEFEFLSTLTHPGIIKVVRISLSRCRGDSGENLKSPAAWALRV